MEATVQSFSRTARSLAAEAHRLGLRAPGFRSPPAGPGRRRGLRRYADGSAMVAVAIRGRGLVDVVDDMIDGVVVANDRRGPEAARLRVALWDALEPLLVERSGAADRVVGGLAPVAAVAA